MKIFASYIFHIDVPGIEDPQRAIAIAKTIVFQQVQKSAEGHDVYLDSAMPTMVKEAAE